MAKELIGRESEAQTPATADRSARRKPTTGKLPRQAATMGEIVQRLAGDDPPGSEDVRAALLAVQRTPGDRSSAQMAGASVGRGGKRSVQEVARSGFQGGGGPLPHIARVQASFGAHDISDVRSFTGPGTRAASRALSAEAYASGGRVGFADPAPSLHTVAHEAAHVIQQRAGIRLPGGIDRPGDAHERHADAVAEKVVRGESAERSLDTYFSARGASSPASGGDTSVQRSLGGELAADVDTGKNETTQTAERYATIIEKLAEAIAEKNKKGETLSINPDAVLAPMIYRLEKRDGDFSYETYGHLIEALKARGAILIDGQESGKVEEEATDKLVINLLLPGSGDRRWRTFAENMIGDGVATRKDMFSKLKEVSGDDKKTRSKLGVESGKLKYPTFYEHPGSIRTGLTYMIRGPGTTDSTSSHPSNNIANNVKTATAIVESYLRDWPEEKVKIRIMGHSRNGVTAALLTRGLRSAHAKLAIDSVIFDAVPGGDAKALHGYEEATLPDDPETDEDVNSTVIYSLMDDRAGFNPMLVYGAKRLILTHYSHHAGIEPGFTYDGKHLKGLGLLDLPDGLFIDAKLSAGKANLLTGPITDWDYIKIVLTVANMEKGGKNKNRLARIVKILEAFLKTKPDDLSEFDDLSEPDV